MVWISYRLAKYSETVRLTSRQARSALWAVSENSWRLGEIIYDPHGEGRGDWREPSFMNANEKTELCNRHRFNKLLHTYFYFFFWFEEITFPWIFNTNDGEMKIQNHIFPKRNERANSKMHNEPQLTRS